MKRGLVLSLCAAFAAAVASPALAVVNVQLNLRYVNPADAASGGTWDLLVQSTGLQGLAGLAADITANTSVTGTDTPLAAITPGVFNNTSNVFRFSLKSAGVTHLVAGDDLAPANSLTLGVGTPTFATIDTVGTPGRVVNDDLFPTSTGAASTKWDNSTRIASGSWTGARPTIANILANEFDANAQTAKAVVATIVNVSVRGDSLADGIKAGDADRNGTVNSGDLNLVLSSFNQAGKTWDQGNLDGVGVVNSGDLNLVLSTFNQVATAPAASAAVTSAPEPGSLALVAFGIAGLAGRLRRKQR